MKRLPGFATLAFALLVIAACSNEPPGNLITDLGSPYYATFAEAQEAARLGDKAVLIDFYTDW